MTVVAVTPVAGEMGFELVAWNKVFAGVNHLYQSCTYQKDKKSLLWSVFPANTVGLPILFALFTVWSKLYYIFIVFIFYVIL